MDNLEVCYQFNDIIYKIVGTTALHEHLKNDGDFFENYVSNNETSLEMQVPEDIQNEESWTWTKKAILLLVQCLKERKVDLRNPKIKKKDLWKTICKEMAKQGYTNLDEAIIERKFRNMKNTYKTIKDNKKKSSTGRGTVKWEYYDLMDEVFEEDKTINLGSTVSSMSLTKRKSRIYHEKMTPIENLAGPPSASAVTEDSSMAHIENLTGPVASVVSEDSYIGHIENLASSSVATAVTSDVQPSLIHSASLLPSSSAVGEIFSPTTKAERGKKLYGLRKKQIELEENRVSELRLLREAVEQSNHIQAERNKLLKILIDRQTT